MAKEIYRKIVNLIIKASKLARDVGIDNLLQPGLIKEMIISDILGHTLITSKRNADAHDPNNNKLIYEYLTCKEGGSGQIDRMYKYPESDKKKSMQRILRNHKIYLAVFYEYDQTKVKTIIEIDTSIAAKEAERQIQNSKRNAAHIRFSENWAYKNGKVVYKN